MAGAARRQALAQCRQLLVEPLGELAPAGEAVGRVVQRLAAGLDELLASFDGGEQLGATRVAAPDFLGQRLGFLAAGGEQRFGAMERGGELGVGGAQLAEAVADLVEARLHRVPAPQQHGAEQMPVLGLVLAVAPRRARLPLERAHRALDLEDHVLESLQVAVGFLELDLGDALARLVLGDAGRFLDQATPFLRLAGEDRLDLPLPDHRVGAQTEPGVHQQVAHLLQRDVLAVDAVLALAGAEDPPADLDPAFDRGGDRRIGLQEDVDLGHPQRLATLRAVEDDVLHRFAAEELGALLAHAPGQGFDEVRLAAAVRSHDGGDAGGERGRDRVDEGLEAGDLESVEAQHGWVARYQTVRRAATRDCGRLAEGHNILWKTQRDAALRGGSAAASRRAPDTSQS